MKQSKMILFVVFLVVLLGAYLFLKKEGFTSPGTMVQLASSHVPTREDEDYLRYVYPREVRHDLIDLTGSDPGPIAVPMPQLWLL